MSRNRIRINKFAYDRIILNNQDLQEINSFLDSINLKEQSGNIFSITEGVVTVDTSHILKGSTLDFYFNVDDDMNILIIGLHENGESFYQGKVTLNKSGFNIHVIQKSLDYQKTKDSIQASYNILIDFLMYTYLKQSETKIKVIKKNPFVPKGDKIPNVSKKRKNGQRNVVKLSEGKTVYQYENAEEELSEGDKRKYERHAEAWSVRGHYRNLKSGKSVWVRGHKKGEGKKKGKDYTI